MNNIKHTQTYNFSGIYVGIAIWTDKNQIKKFSLSKNILRQLLLLSQKKCTNEKHSVSSVQQIDQKTCFRDQH